MPDTLTDAELARIEAELADEWAYTDSVRDVEYYEMLADLGALASALRQARGLVAALVSDEAVLRQGIPGGYIDCDDDRRLCTYCYTRWGPDEPERHAEYCEVAAARDALSAWAGEGIDDD